MSRAGIARLLRRPPAASWRLIGGVTAVNLLLAAVSFAKDLSFAAYFGTSRSADLVNTAFLLPEAIGYNLIAAVVGIAAVPELARRWQEPDGGSFLRCTLRLTLHTALFMIAVGVALVLARHQLFAMSGYPPGAEETARLDRLFLLLLVSLPLFPLYAVGGAALQAAGAFYAAAAGPVLLNGLMLAAIAASAAAGASVREGELAYAASIVAGAGGMAALVWLALKRRWRAERGRFAAAAGSGRPPRGSLAPSSGLGRVYRDLLPLLLLTLFSQGQYAAERMLASNQAEGTLAALNYAYRIAQFPNWVFVAAVTSVLLPSISRASALGGGERAAKAELYRALRGTLLLMIPAAAVLCFLREPIVSLLFGRGAFDAQSAAMTSGLLTGYSLSVVGQAVSGVILRYLTAYGRLYGAAAVCFASAAVTVLTDVLAVGPFGAEALGFGSLIGWTLNAILMFAIVVREPKVWRG